MKACFLVFLLLLHSDLSVLLECYKNTVREEVSGKPTYMNPLSCLWFLPLLIAGAYPVIQRPPSPKRNYSNCQGVKLRMGDNFSLYKNVNMYINVSIHI